MGGWLTAAGKARDKIWPANEPAWFRRRASCPVGGLRPSPEADASDGLCARAARAPTTQRYELRLRIPRSILNADDTAAGLAGPYGNIEITFPLA